jgi:hypothetical protein
MNLKDLNENFSIVGIFQNKKISFYFSITFDILKNIHKITASDTYKNRFDFKNILTYLAISIFILFFVVVLPLVFFRNMGDIAVPTLFFRITGFIFLLAFIYSSLIFLISGVFSFKKITLTLLLIYAFIIPLFGLLSLPIFFNMKNVSIGFFLGGGHSAINLISTNIFLEIYTAAITLIIAAIPAIILPIVWLTQILKLRRWWLLIFINQAAGILAINILTFVNPYLLHITKIADKFIGLL